MLQKTVLNPLAESSNGDKWLTLKVEAFTASTFFRIFYRYYIGMNLYLERSFSMKKNKEVDEKTVEKESLKEKFNKTIESVLDYIAKNPMAIIALSSGLASIFGGIFKIIYGHSSRNVAWVSDDVTGEKFLVKHKLNNDEILELGGRMIDGEWKGEALSEMGLLKRERRRK